MELLEEILKNEKNPAVIFGRIHHRQAALDALTSTRGGGIDYTKLTCPQLEDLALIKIFFYHLTRPYYLCDHDTLMAARRNDWSVGEARALAGLPTDSSSLDFAISLVRRVMGREEPQGSDIYASLALDADEHRAAVA